MRRALSTLAPQSALARGWRPPNVSSGSASTPRTASADIEVERVAATTAAALAALSGIRAADRAPDAQRAQELRDPGVKLLQAGSHALLLDQPRQSVCRQVLHEIADLRRGELRHGIHSSRLLLLPALESLVLKLSGGVGDSLVQAGLSECGSLIKRATALPTLCHIRRTWPIQDSAVRSELA